MNHFSDRRQVLGGLAAAGALAAGSLLQGCGTTRAAAPAAPVLLPASATAGTCESV